jgi:nucleotide-binding universal stress UspA family protein
MELQINKILVPIDFSDNSKAALKIACQFGVFFQAELILIHVVEPMFYPPDFSLGQITVPSVDTKDIETQANQELAKLALMEIRGQLQFRSIVKSGKPFSEIIDTASDEDVDLIIISSHGHSEVEQILFGSTSEKVVRKAPCPVLTLRDPIKGFDYRQALQNQSL